MRKKVQIGFLLMVIFTASAPVHTARAQVVDTLLRVFEDIKDQMLYRNYDSNYIVSYPDQIAAKLVAVSKVNYFRIKDRNSKSTLRYQPVRDIRLGIGMAYKFFAFDLTMSVGINNKSDFTDTRSFDLQGRIFSSKQLISGTLQYYRGYRISGANGNKLNKNDPNLQRKDVRTVNVLFQYMYALNYTKFSMKSPFVFNERQKKSAGSTILGIQLGLMNMNADSSIIPTEVQGYFGPDTYIKSANVLHAGIQAGYMYTFVLKRYFITASIIPGLVLNYGDYSIDGINNLPTTINLSLTSMNAIGYNGEKFFAGFNFLWDNFYTRINSSARMEFGTGKISAFIGYRFGQHRP